jgi:hypothetical protein
MTPVLETTEPHGRYREVQQYLREHGADGETWVALEDDPNHFPAGCANVMLLDPETGFDAATREMLLQRAT